MLLLLLFLLMFGFSGAETNKPVSVLVIEGDDITLETGLTAILNGDTIVWLSGTKDTFLSQIAKKDDIPSFFVTDDVAFSGRLQVNQNTGSLTIRNTRIRHSGQYKVSIAREETTTKIFNVTVSAVAGETDVKTDSVSAMEGEPVTLKSDAGKYNDALMLWRFGDKGVLLAKIDTAMNETLLNKTDERFKGRIELNQKGSLIIKNSRTTDSGLYELQIKGSESHVKTFIVSVSDSSMSSGAIAGIVLGVLLLVGAVVTPIAYYYSISDYKKKTEKKKEVYEGDSVTLESGIKKIQEKDQIKWLFGAKDNVIANNDSGNNETFPGTDGRFRSKLRMDNNGNLTISNIRNIHSGLYKLKIKRGDKTKKNVYKIFIVTVTVKTIEVREGETVTLDSTIEVKKGETAAPDSTIEVKKGETVAPDSSAKINGDDLILWTFGPENLLVIKNNGSTEDINEKFRDRLTLDHKTGSLEIRNITTKDSGHFKLQVINYEKTEFRRFNVKVTARTENPGNESTQLLMRQEGQVQFNKLSAMTEG